MKDAVKITVIATGFKDSDRARRHRTTQTGFTTRDMDDDFPDNDRDSEPAPPPMIMEAQQPAAAANAGGMTANMAPPAVVAKFEKDDLDVPAFLRKRNDVM